MTEAARYLTSLAQALAKMSLYAEGHPARGRAAEVSFDMLRELQRDDPRPTFSFLGREVIHNQRSLRELSDWDWSERLSSCGVQRLEFDGLVGKEEYHEFLEDVLSRISLQPAESVISALERPRRPTPIRFGAIGLRDSAMGEGQGAHQAEFAVLPGVFVDVSEEAEAVSWVHGEVLRSRMLPVSEAELVVGSLSTAMHGDRNLLLPLLTLKDFDQYTTTHALNVAVLAMGLAEHMGLSGREARAYGVAGLLHDLGKVRVPPDILRKPGALTDGERAVLQKHPVDGAQLILSGSRKHDLCAAVAFEHHIMIDGGGYPNRQTRRDCHHASLLVHVCDVFDALRTHRPYRVAWVTPSILAYIERRIGTEFDADVSRAFINMMEEWELRHAMADSLEPEDLASGRSL
jgi:hypothetical protein